MDYYLLGAHDVFGIPKNTSGNDLAAVGKFPLFTASVSVALTFHELAVSCSSIPAIATPSPSSAAPTRATRRTARQDQNPRPYTQSAAAHCP